MVSTDASQTPGGWPRRAVLSLAALGGAAGLTGGLSGCNSGGDDAQSGLKQKIEDPGDNVHRKGFPIVDKPITLHYMTGKPPNDASDYNEVASWKKYQALTNIKVDWGLTPTEDLNEKQNLALSSGDYPEAFYVANMGTLDAAKYADQDVFVNLDELIDEYMPNIKHWMHEYQDVKRSMTFPDGGVYGLPRLVDPKFSEVRVDHKLWVRGDWLDKFDMEVPRSLTEYHRYLKAVKAKKPNGKSDAIGYCDQFAGNQLMTLAGAFGVQNRGRAQNFLDADPGDSTKVRFFPVSDAYHALLEYLHRLYSEGLIAKNVFSVDQAKVLQAAAKGTYGSVADISPPDKMGGKAKHFVPVPAMKGPDGDHAYNFVWPPVTNTIAFAMTDKNEHPVETARWMDYFYSANGTKLFHMGVEGESYKETSDGPQYLDKITDNPKGLTQDEALKPYVTYLGGGYPALLKKGYFFGVEVSTAASNAAQLLKPDIPDETWSSFTYTQSESEQLESLSSDIEKYVNESRDKFISGRTSLSDWKKYVDKIKQMGLDDYMEIQQAAYDRYRKG